jgi:hypothetical protein
MATRAQLLTLRTELLNNVADYGADKAAGNQEAIFKKLVAKHPNAIWNLATNSPTVPALWELVPAITSQQILEVLDPVELGTLTDPQRGWLAILLAAPSVNPSNPAVLQMVKNAFSNAAGPTRVALKRLAYREKTRAEVLNVPVTDIRDVQRALNEYLTQLEYDAYRDKHGLPHEPLMDEE